MNSSLRDRLNFRGLKLKNYQLEYAKGMKYSIIVLLIVGFLFSCKQNEKIPNAIAEIPVNIDILRFDREFAMTHPDKLVELKSRYPFFFPEEVPDSIWLAKLNDSLQQQLLRAVDSVFGSFEQEEHELKLLYKHLRYFFPDKQIPDRIITLTSDVDYANRIILADTLLLIALDNYLGSEHRFYSGFDRYIAQGLDRKFLLRDVALTHTSHHIPPPSDRSFLAQMIYHGKRLYLSRLLVPELTDAQVLGYSDEQYDWAQANEDPIWRYFIERELLYDTDRELGRRFIEDAPFSKFRLELDRESPGRIGRYMGWRIVESYAANQDVELQELLKLPAKSLFMQSKFKPRK